MKMAENNYLYLTWQDSTLYGFFICKNPQFRYFIS